jgi:site-specific DNA recombinase
MRVRIIQPTPKVERKKRVCAYARVSTESDLQAQSIENQVTTYQNLISSNPEYEFIDVFADRGFTGTSENRPEFQRMLQMCRDGKIDLIITKSVSRFARNTTIVLQTVRELKDIGVEVQFEQENVSTMSGDGELMLSVLSSFAEEESRSTSENMKWRIKKKFEKGELIINTKRFLGYDKDEYGDLVINHTEAKVVQRIYTEYLKGNGSFKIAKMLNEDGVPTVTGVKWSDSSVLDILKNEKYKGDAILQKTFRVSHINRKKRRNTGERDSFYVKENHSPIITREMWDEVQRELKRRAEAKGNFIGSGKSQNRYPQTGMLFCSKCGAVLKRRIWNSQYQCRKVMWQCSNYVKNGKEACGGTTVEDRLVSKIVEPTVVREEMRYGKKYYSYSNKSNEPEPSGEYGTEQKENGSVLQGVNRPRRTVIQL